MNTVLQRTLSRFDARLSILRVTRRHRRQAHGNVSTKESTNPAQPPHPAPEVADTRKAPLDIPSPTWHQRLGPISSFFSWFHRTQRKRPYTVQVCSSLTVYLCGDLLAQDMGGEQYDPYRTLRMLTIGAVASIPGYRW